MTPAAPAPRLPVIITDAPPQVGPPGRLHGCAFDAPTLLRLSVLKPRPRYQGHGRFDLRPAVTGAWYLPEDPVASRDRRSVDAPLIARMKLGYSTSTCGSIPLLRGGILSPTIFKVGPFRFFFFSREEARAHVHVESSEGGAKFWLEPTVELARSHGLTQRDLRRIREIIHERRGEIRDAWNRHFER